MWLGQIEQSGAVLLRYPGRAQPRCQAHSWSLQRVLSEDVLQPFVVGGGADAGGADRRSDGSRSSGLGGRRTGTMGCMSRRRSSRSPARQPRMDSASACPCGLPASYQECCGAMHRGVAAAPTAERLMRSRFSAFSVGDVAYLLRTWHPTTRPARLELDKGLRWVRLEVLETTGGSFVHAEGTVRFRAHYVSRGVEGHLDENSRFVRVEGAWVYLGAL